jgi:hypothetical protein
MWKQSKRETRWAVSHTALWDKPTGYQYPQFRDIATWRQLGAEDDVKLPVPLYAVPHERWPEAPDDGRIIAYGE